MSSSPITDFIWRSRYRYAPTGGNGESDLGQTWRRVARAVAGVEAEPQVWEDRFHAALSRFLFLPGGRILAGAGTGRRVTLMNCFVAGGLEDSLEGILDSLREAALTMQFGGGIGCDFSPLRAAGSPAVRSASVASGPVAFMRVWDAMCDALLAMSPRRGAMMGTLRCDHPDIEAFIDAKREPGTLASFNLSVLISDEFMRAVHDDGLWTLSYPLPAPPVGSVDDGAIRSVSARDLWRGIIRAAHATDEPGILFVDRINRENNLYYCEDIAAANPCGEIPLPPFGACDLGSINLTALVRDPFTTESRLDHGLLRDTVQLAVRFLDDVIDVSRFPIARQAEQARNTRRIGLGITGLADMLIMLGHGYDSVAGREVAAATMQLIRDTAYAASVALAAEKGPFPALDRVRYLDAPFVRRLPERLQGAIERRGIRNSHLLAIAPAGTISLLAGNVSSGIEPVYALDSERAIRDSGSKIESLPLRDYAYRLWASHAAQGEDLPVAFVTAGDLPAAAHLSMQACLQQFVDQGISKTVNLPEDASQDDVEMVYSQADELGVKGCTVFRAGTDKAQVLRKCAAAAGVGRSG